MLEAAEHGENNVFVTLTYSDDKLPANNSLDPRALSLFLKRLRKVCGRPIRFYACGEYGSRTGRPHYHLALFGYSPCFWGITRTGRVACCDSCDRVFRAWGQGGVLLGTLEQNSAQYIAGYVSKKYTSAQSYKGRVKPFSRMSLRPGIGAGMMDEVASTLMQHGFEEKLDDVPTHLAHGAKNWPIGRYLRRRLRTRIGREGNSPAATLQKIEKDLQPVREAAFNNSQSLKKAVLSLTEGQRIKIYARERRSKRETI